MKIEIGNDHRGFGFKCRVVEWLTGQGYQVTDHGCYGPDSADYPDFAYAAARAVAANPGSRGIVICSNGIGVSMAANKVPGIRAALCVNTRMASQSRRHNNANMIAIGADNASEEENLEILSTWLATEFEGERHETRVNKLMQGEES